MPVKIYSFHLMFMAVVLMLGDGGRLACLFLGNRPAEARDLRPAYTGKYSIWLQRSVKAAIIIYLFALPIYKHTKAEILHAQAAGPGTEQEDLDGDASKDESEHLLMNRGFRWVNQIPFHR